jgi:hypothetical protein
MNVYTAAAIINAACLTATVAVCWVTHSPWGLMCLLGLTSAKSDRNDEKADGQKETKE